MKQLFKSTPLFFLLSLMAAGAQAAQISIVSMVGNWRNPSFSGSGVSGITNGDPTSSINWGGTVSVSGYDFTKSIPGPQTLPPAPTPFFPLGTFTHRNQDLTVNPSYTTLNNVLLDVVVTLNVNGTPVGPLTFTFTFNHDETTNTGSIGQCDPSKLNPTSTVPCPDVVTFTASPNPTTFQVAGVDYTLAMSFVDSQGNPVSRFITEEHQINVANLVGQFRLPPPPPSCGDHICNGTDTCSNCPQDCGACVPPPPPPPPPSSCGDNICSGSETCASCSRDCGVCPPPPPSSCGDNICNGSDTCSNCSQDCGVCTPPPPDCGDNICNGSNNCANCATDCGHCPPPPPPPQPLPGASSFDLSLAKAYPVPYKSTSKSGGINFVGLATGARIRIFSTDGHLVETLHADNNILWPVTNRNGEKVASGVYFYRIDNSAGQVKEGKIVIIQ